MASVSADAAANIAVVLTRPTESAEARRLHWQAQALRANLKCRDGRADGRSDGSSLRASILAEALSEQPERIALQHRLAAITAVCVNSATANRVRGRLP